jgi:hypothetical protein
MRSKRLEEGFAEAERLRATELRNQASVKDRREYLEFMRLMDISTPLL